MINYSETKKGIKALQNNQLGTKPKITQTRDEALKLKQTWNQTQVRISSEGQSPKKYEPNKD